MAPRTALLCLMLGLLFASAPAKITVRGPSFDFYYLILMWPGSYCAQSENGCCWPTDGVPVQGFHIKRFMPYDLEKDRPVARCQNDHEPFDVHKMGYLLPELYGFWSDVRCPSREEESTWKLAWETYGVCSGLDQPKYFEAALAIAITVNPLEFLQSQGINDDGKTYSVESIKEAARQSTGLTTLGVQCKGGQLYQIYFCVDKDDQKLIDCPRLPRGLDCPEEVVFPEFVLSMLNGTATSLMKLAKPRIRLPTTTKAAV